ncbi:MAG: hypothetical protein COB36_02850 [Alphaproteobacteria bacterium]|nr:MAG: hypothetical protein COB36_02850 [Alphaproteobacteria bacterium]
MRFFLILGFVGVGFLINLNGFETGLFQVVNAKTVVEREYDFQTLLELAEKGDVKAQYKIALKYDRGDGVSENITQAMKWYLRAAEKGGVLAQYRLGSLYSSGQKVPKDMDKAVEWYGKSAAQGNTWAHLNLAPIYLIGLGVPQDVDKAIALYTEASELGDVNCQLSLAIQYYNGEYIPKNFEKAAYWFSKVAEKGNKAAQDYLDEMNEIKKPILKMVKNRDRQDFMNLYRVKEQISTDEFDCMEGGYSQKECSCVLEEDYDYLRKTLKVTMERRAGWKGKILSYRNKKGQGVAMSFAAVKSAIDMYDQTCKK